MPATAVGLVAGLAAGLGAAPVVADTPATAVVGAIVVVVGVEDDGEELDGELDDGLDDEPDDVPDDEDDDWVFVNVQVTVVPFASLPVKVIVAVRDDRFVLPPLVQEMFVRLNWFDRLLPSATV